MIGIQAMDFIDDDRFRCLVGYGDDITLACLCVDLQVGRTEITHVDGSGCASHRYGVEEKVLEIHIRVLVRLSLQAPDGGIPL